MRMEHEAAKKALEATERVLAGDVSSEEEEEAAVAAASGVPPPMPPALPGAGASEDAATQGGGANEGDEEEGEVKDDDGDASAPRVLPPVVSEPIDGSMHVEFNAPLTPCLFALPLAPCPSPPSRACIILYATDAP